jgi:hypothetical protein
MTESQLAASVAQYFALALPANARNQLCILGCEEAGSSGVPPKLVGGSVPAILSSLTNN